MHNKKVYLSYTPTEKFFILKKVALIVRFYHKKYISRIIRLIFTTTTAATSKWIKMFSSVFSCPLNEFDL